MQASGPRDIAPVYNLKKSAARSLWATHSEPPPRGPVQFLTKQVWPWLVNYLSVMLHRRHAFNSYRAGTGVFAIPNTVTVALAADWGTGTIPAYKVANQIRSLDPHPDITIHMGDVYYSGTSQEYTDWFLGEEDWPRGTQHTFAMNANHEMYSGGAGYFDTALGTLKQETSYFCLETDYWRVLGLDSGYYSGILPLLEKFWRSRIRLDDHILQWLQSVVFADRSDQRPVVVLTHHQPFSAFGPGYPTLGKNLAPYLDRVLLWLWGHEHRFAGYGPVAVGGLPVIRGRCIGHGGMPIELAEPPKNPGQTNLVFYDDRLDGELSEIVREPVGYCGFAVLHLDGPKITIDYIDENNVLLLRESWNRAGTAPVGSIIASDNDLHVVHTAGLDELVR